MIYNNFFKKDFDIDICPKPMYDNYEHMPTKDIVVKLIEKGMNDIAAIVDEEKCIGCGQCADICPVDAISMYNGKAVISEECIECGSCVTTCPVEAIMLP